MNKENKCEELNIQHAWRGKKKMWGFEVVYSEECANCGLSRNRRSSTKEWWAYSDGRPDEEIVNIRPV